MAARQRQQQLLQHQLQQARIAAAAAAAAAAAKQARPSSQPHTTPTYPPSTPSPLTSLTSPSPSMVGHGDGRGGMGGSGVDYLDNSPPTYESPEKQISHEKATNPLLVNLLDGMLFWIIRLDIFPPLNPIWYMGRVSVLVCLSPVLSVR